MTHFLQGLFRDQLCRVTATLEEMRTNRANPNVPRFFVDKTLSLLTSLKVDIEALIDSGDLLIDEPVIRATNIADYNKHDTRFKEIEAYRCQVILRYGDRESQFSKVLERIYNELDIHQEPPIVTFVSDSEDYYWAFPTHDIIAVPAGEERHLLNLPDLYHEIGHYIYDQFSTILIRSIRDDVTLHFDREISIAHDQGMAKLESDLLEKKNRWLSGWIEEYVCDMIGSYTTGPAYAWTNFKISSIVSKEKNIYTDSIVHPSDESRMHAIRSILYREGLADELVRLNADWEIYADSPVNVKPLSYASFFPERLIDQLAHWVWQGCRDIGLRSYFNQQSVHRRPVSVILNEAWEVLRIDSIGYAAWECNQIQQIKVE